MILYCFCITAWHIVSAEISRIPFYRSIRMKAFILDGLWDLRCQKKLIKYFLVLIFRIMEPNQVLHLYLRSNLPLLRLPDSNHLLLSRQRSLHSSDLYDIRIPTRGSKTNGVYRGWRSFDNTRLWAAQLLRDYDLFWEQIKHHILFTAFLIQTLSCTLILMFVFCV